jgi:hypothetical protein
MQKVFTMFIVSKKSCFIIFFPLLLVGCYKSWVSNSILESSPTQATKILTQTYLPTEGVKSIGTQTPTETITPTEVPLFTDAEVEAADPFDLSTFPSRIIEIEEHPEKATYAEWQSAHDFIVAVRGKKGISPIVEYSNRIRSSELGSLCNFIKYIQGDLKNTREKMEKTVFSPIEMKLMWEDNTRIDSWYAKGIDNRFYDFGFDTGITPYLEGDRTRYYEPENIGPIMGKDDIHPNRPPYISVGGNFAAIGTFVGRDFALIDIVSKDGFHRLFPVMVSFEPITLPKGSKCISTTSNSDPIYILPAEISLEGITTGNGRILSQKELFAGLGKWVLFTDSSYTHDIKIKFNLWAISPTCFSPEGLEMASEFSVDEYLDAKYWPWVVEVPETAPTPG